ncbi:unnamed protein product [Linum trigynum]|uniref:Uncharacterized protein n=1 Tax=Linum trigynum TaxID=586398 RepID=A0AAV2CLJ2_9ROSI
MTRLNKALLEVGVVLNNDTHDSVEQGEGHPKSPSKEPLDWERNTVASSVGVLLPCYASQLYANVNDVEMRMLALGT